METTVKRKGIGGHQSAKMITDEWLTPPAIVKALGKFDLDPCSPVNRPWDTAATHYTVLDDGFNKEWFGRVWMNPPYGSECAKWLNKLAGHGNGISIIFARTETKMFFDHVWDKANSVFFFEGRLYFHTVDGVRAKANAGAPNCLISYGENNAQAIEESGLKGKHISLAPTMIVIGVSPSWKAVVSMVINRMAGEATVQAITDMVETMAPDKVNSNIHYREKIRQILQLHFERKGRGIYANQKQAA